MNKVHERILLLTDILLGVVYSDGSPPPEEKRAVRRLLAELLQVPADRLPHDVEQRIQRFRPELFDLGAAAADFSQDPPMKKRRLLELVGKMSQSDGVVDLAEDDYLRALASHLGMEPSEYNDLVVDYEVEELRKSFQELVGVVEATILAPK